MALSALQYASLKLNFRAFTSANRYTVANLSESDLLSFWNQLGTDAASAVALNAAQDAAVDRTLRALLCANNSLVGLPDADWTSLFTQLSADSAGAASLPAGQYSALKLQLRALISGYRVPPFNLSEPDLLGYLKPRVNAFDGNFTGLFTAPYQGMQADRGLTYGATPKATTGNTSTTAITQGGTTPTIPVPVLYKATNSAAVGAGATFSISFDGGSTFAMTGVTPTAGVPVALTGAGTNITATWSAGNGVNNDTWNATAAGNTDQSGNGLHYTQAVAAAQPIVQYGPDGKLELLYDGVDDFYQSALNNQPNMLVWLVVRQITWGAFRTLVGSGNNLNVRVIFQDGNTVTPNLVAYNGAFLGPAPLTLGTCGRIAAVFNDASSTMKVGANALASGDVGATVGGAGRSIGCDRWNATAINFANVAVRAVVHAPAQSYASADAAASSYWGAAI